MVSFGVYMLLQVNVTRMASPFGTCQDPSQANGTSNVYKDLYSSITYSTLVCMRSHIF